MVLCAALVAAPLSTPAHAQEAVQVAPFGVVAMLLNVLLAEKACKGLAVDQSAFKRYLADHSIDGAQLSRTGPHGADVVQTRRKLRTAFARHNKEACDLSFAMFGPNGTAIRGLIIAH